MLSLETIREDLKHIKYYNAHKEMFLEMSNSVGNMDILNKIALYNKCICSASPQLYDIYVSLYLKTCTQNELAERIGYSFEYVSKLNTKLIKFFQSVIKIEDYSNI
jgi:hypothetical protein